MTKFNCTAVAVPELVTEAFVPAAPVVVLLIVIVGVAPVGPVWPMGPGGPPAPCAASRAHVAALPAAPEGGTPVLAVIARYEALAKVTASFALYGNDALHAPW